jgi:hypothetical protein
MQLWEFRPRQIDQGLFVMISVCKILKLHLCPWVAFLELFSWQCVQAAINEGQLVKTQRSKDRGLFLNRLATPTYGQSPFWRTWVGNSSSDMNMAWRPLLAEWGSQYWWPRHNVSPDIGNFQPCGQSAKLVFWRTWVRTLYGHELVWW